MRARIFAGAVLLAGCSFMSRSAPLEVRYFSPEPVEAARVAPGAKEAAAARLKLRLGDFTSSANLRERIVHRESPVEVGVYDTLRWTENPEWYVRRSLSRALFEDRPIEHVLGGTAPVLDVELLSFEVVRDGNSWSGRVQLRYGLHDERTVIASGVITSEQPAPAADAGFDGAVRAVGVAMNAVTSKLASEVAARLAP